MRLIMTARLLAAASRGAVNNASCLDSKPSMRRWNIYRFTLSGNSSATTSSDNAHKLTKDIEPRVAGSTISAVIAVYAADTIPGGKYNSSKLPGMAKAFVRASRPASADTISRKRSSLTSSHNATSITAAAARTEGSADGMPSTSSSSFSGWTPRCCSGVPSPPASKYDGGGVHAPAYVVHSTLPRPGISSAGASSPGPTGSKRVFHSALLSPGKASSEASSSSPRGDNRVFHSALLSPGKVS
mmetsp:Transcript_41314/g.118852  ORF Transcript_41314/g.118852 Transcript_41314/m.118852 type:complete len:243 (-) Transcript_41314:382-1110(-)